MQPTNTVCLNPFAVVNGCSVTIALISVAISEVDPSSVLAVRAVAATKAIAPILLCAGAKKGSCLTSVDVTALLQLDNLCAVADSKTASDSAASSDQSIELPIEVVNGVRSYLSDLPDFSQRDVFLAKTSEARKLLSFDMMVLKEAISKVERLIHAPETVHA